MKQFEIFIKNQDIMPYPPTNFFNLFQFYFANTNIILIFASVKNISVNTVEEHRLTALKYYEHFLCSKVANIWLPILYLFALRSVLMFLTNGIWQPFFCLNVKNIKTMKEISIEAKVSRAQEHKALSSVKSYAKSHAEKIGIPTSLLGLSYAMLAIEADNFIPALIAIAISAVIMLLVKKGGSHE